MTRRFLTVSVICFGLLGLAATAAQAAARGGLPTVLAPGDDSGGGGIPSGFIALFVIAAIAGVGVTIWRISAARSIARGAGMDPNQATAVTLLGNTGLDAAYIAANVRAGQAPAASAPAPAPSAPAAAAAPPRTTEERLAELQHLHDQGLVTIEEYQSRRTAILDTV